MEKGKLIYKLPEGWVEASIDVFSNYIHTSSKRVSGNYGGYYSFFKPPDLNSGTVYSAKENLTEKGKNGAIIIS